jgi:glucose/arabinose dehydrogenase
VLGLVVAAVLSGSGGSVARGDSGSPAPGFLGGASPREGAATVVQPGFQDSVVISGLTNPTNLRFASDGRIFVAQKNGVVKVFHGFSDTNPTTVIDLSTEVDNYWDRGLLGMALDPNFPASPYIYLLYTYDGAIGQTAPIWNDACPTPPGPTTDGCLVSGRLVRVQLSGDVATGTPQILIKDQWCQQYPSHSIGDLVFAPDGSLYVSGGDGASFTFADYGQGGGSTGSPTPKNPCGDPPAGVGGTETAPTAEGGRLRSQSIRRAAGEPVLLNGTVLRVDPTTGLGMADNPNGSSPDPNTKRIIAYGLRNPFRLVFRPGTNDLWLGDVGDATWEEINRVPPGSPVLNFGWPCYEGTPPNAGYQSIGLNLCTSLYNAGTATPPYFSYNHGQDVVAGDACPTVGSPGANGTVISALAFYQSGSYPSSYNGALFFGDHSRNCIWAMMPGSSGLPDPTTIKTMIQSAANPVDLELGPGGDLFYVDFDGGTIHRITYNAQTSTDLALGKPATASSTEPNSNLVPANANDGNSATRWGSAWTDNQWWQVDLGSAQQVGSVSLNWEAAYPTSYKIQTSTDGTTFTDAATVADSAPGWQTTSFGPVSARYVRVLGVTRATQYGISLWDAQVFGPSTATLPVNQAPPTITGFAGRGVKLTGGTGVWSPQPTSYNYQWQQCSSSGSNCQPIAGATSATYSPAAGDVGQTVEVSVAASNSAGTTQPVNSLPTAIVRQDIALNQPASASSSENTTTLVPANANDGNSLTRWGSQWIDNQWWQVDLGTAQPIDTVSLDWEAAYPSSYKIQVSTDGTTFTDVASVSASSSGWQTTSFSATTARYVRVLGVTRATQYGISLWDAAVFGVNGPIPVIDTPSSTFTYAVGDQIPFSGHATDPTDGNLPQSALTWTAIIHHCTTPSTCHTHTISGLTPGTPFYAPDHDYPSYLELDLTATDSRGLSSTTSVNIQPKTVDLSFATQPAGLSLAVQGASFTAPFTKTVIINSQNSISAPTSQVLNGVTYQFTGWSDSGQATHNIFAPATATTYTATYTPVSSGCTTDQFDAQYFSNMTLTGPPVLDRCESAPINYDWGTGSPDPSVPVDNFSARWTGNFTFATAGTYTFTATADDGIRVFVDGNTANPVINAWVDQSATTYTGSVTLTAGVHSVVVEYYEHLIDAVAKVSWALGSTPSVNLNFATSPTGLLLSVNGTSSTAPFSRTVNVGSTVTLSAPASQTLNGTTYNFVSWSDGGAASHSVTAPSTSTTYTATYQAQGGVTCTTGHYHAQYFSNMNLTGTPTIDRCEGAPINYNWGNGSPGSGVPVDHFSARWTGSFTFTAGSHTFTATTDDGMRVFVDGTQIINGWKDQSAKTYTAKVNLTAGIHAVIVEYYEDTGQAVAKMSFT